VKTTGLKFPRDIKIVAVEAKNMYNPGEGLTMEMKKVIPATIEEVKSFKRKIES